MEQSAKDDASKAAPAPEKQLTIADEKPAPTPATETTEETEAKPGPMATIHTKETICFKRGHHDYGANGVCQTCGTKKGKS